MKERQYIASRQSEWEAWDRWLSTGQKVATGDQRAPTIGASELPHRFRRLCHDLALVRSRHYSAAVDEDLQRRVLAVHQQIYGAAGPEAASIRRFLVAGFPQLVRREWRLVAVAGAVFFLPMLLILAAIQVWPDLAFLILSPETVGRAEEMYSPTATRLGRPRTASSEWSMWGFYIANNVRIDFQAFAGGIAFGLGTLFYLLYNALYIGAVAGHLTQIGFTATFWGFVAGHSAFELTGAALSGAAGLKIGAALVAPGNRRRLDALRENSRIAVQLLYGAAGLTFCAAFIEAFWSPVRSVPLAVKVGVGVVWWLLTAVYLVFAGRPTRAP